MCAFESCGHIACGQIEHIALRGAAWSAATSKVEQSFSKIDANLCKNRLSASAPVENMNVNLFMSADVTEAELESVIDGAIMIWKMYRPWSHSRMHTVDRRDKGFPKDVCAQASSSGGEKPTEKAFLSNVRSVVAKSSKRGASGALLEAVVPLWDKGHENELAFQKQKRRKKEVEACLQDHLLPDDSPIATRLECGSVPCCKRRT